MKKSSKLSVFPLHMVTNGCVSDVQVRHTHTHTAQFLGIQQNSETWSAELLDYSGRLVTEDLHQSKNKNKCCVTEIKIYVQHA